MKTMGGTKTCLTPLRLPWQRTIRLWVNPHDGAMLGGSAVALIHHALAWLEAAHDFRLTRVHIWPTDILGPSPRGTG
jgi:hypothetical protein